MILDGYSARVIREWYTHIGGMPTRLQASTRYIDYENFDYVVPEKIKANSESLKVYHNAMQQIMNSFKQLNELGVHKEDSANLLPLGMKTKIVCKHNFRNLADMSHQRMCARAYHEYRELFNDLCNALREYSNEWKILVDEYFKPKCEILGFCTEKFSCGRKPKKEV